MFQDSLYPKSKKTLTGNSHLICPINSDIFYPCVWNHGKVLDCGLLFADGRTDGRRQALAARGARRHHRERLSEPCRLCHGRRCRAGAATSWGPAPREQRGAPRRAGRARPQGRAALPAGTGTARGYAHLARVRAPCTGTRTGHAHRPQPRDHGAPRGNSDWLRRGWGQTDRPMREVRGTGEPMGSRA